MRSALLLVSALSLWAYPSGSRVPNGNAGEPGTGTPCAACHSVTLNPAGGGVQLSLPSGAIFRTGERQRWTLTVSDPDASKAKAFQLTASAGTFSPVTSTVVNSASNGRQYVNQSSPAANFVFDWTPPAGATEITVWMAGVAARGSRSTNVYTATLTLKAAAAAPTISSSNGVVNAAGAAAGIAPGSWVTIYGSNLAPSGVARSWRAEEIVNGRFPAVLEGTRVRINGKEAAISYVSETQVNVQAPDDPSRGSVPVEVETAAGTSAAVLVSMNTAAPAFFRFAAGPGKYAAALHADGVLAGPPGLFGDAVSLRAPKPGDIILLFGNAFGPTIPEVPSLQIFSGAAPLANPSSLQILIGGLPAEVKWAGLSAAGLYQFNVVVPALDSGDHKVEAGLGGLAAAGETLLTVQR